MIVELRWVDKKMPPEPDVFEHVEMPQVPRVGEAVVTAEHGGTVLSVLWTLPFSEEHPVAQVSVK